MHEKTIPICRREWLKKSGALATSLVILPLVAWQRPAQAGSAAKSAFHYRDKPNDGQHCADCYAFIPSDKKMGVEGSCQVVAGVVSANGWCMAFAHKEE